MEITMAEANRIEVIQAVMGHRIDKAQASKVLNRSIRQINRLLIRLRERGIKGMIHGNRGRVSPRKIKDAMRRRILELVSSRYKDVNDTHLMELLERHEKIHIKRETLRSLLRGQGIAPKRKRKRAPYRSRRERKESFGCMVQIDASRHDWLEGRGPWLTLVGGKDDAAGFVWAQFVPSETTWAYLNLMREMSRSHGLPLSLYADRHSIFNILKEPTIIEQLKNTIPLSQFGRAMEELGVTLIKAWSPQAKGRIERNWGIFQDRLVVELRLANVKTMEEANEILKEFLKAYNRRFTVAPREKTAVFRKPPHQHDLDRILCLKEIRTVNKDHTISFEGLILQIPASKRFRSIARRKVDVLQLLDGSIEIMFQKECVARFCHEAINRLLTLNKKENSQLRSAA